MDQSSKHLGKRKGKIRGFSVSGRRFSKSESKPRGHFSDERGTKKANPHLKPNNSRGTRMPKAAA
jgi:hypothetical protein